MACSLSALALIKASFLSMKGWRTLAIATSAITLDEFMDALDRVRKEASDLLSMVFCGCVCRLTIDKGRGRVLVRDGLLGG